MPSAVIRTPLVLLAHDVYTLWLLRAMRRDRGRGRGLGRCHTGGAIRSARIPQSTTPTHRPGRPQVWCCRLTGKRLGGLRANSLDDGQGLPTAVKRIFGIGKCKRHHRSVSPKEQLGASLPCASANEVVRLRPSSSILEVPADPQDLRHALFSPGVSEAEPLFAETLAREYGLATTVEGTVLPSVG